MPSFSDMIEHVAMLRADWLEAEHQYALARVAGRLTDLEKSREAECFYLYRGALEMLDFIYGESTYGDVCKRALEITQGY